MPILWVLLGTLLIFVGGIFLGEGEARKRVGFALLGLFLSLGGLAITLYALFIVNMNFQ